MLLGILDQDGVSEELTGPVALMSLDFVNGIYVIDASLVSAASVVDSPSLIVPGSGLKDTDFPLYTSGLSVSYIGDALSILTASSLTVVMELTIFPVSADSVHYPSYPINIDKNGSVFYSFQFGLNSDGTVTVFENGQVEAPGRRIDTVTIYGPGVHRFGFTLTPEKMSICIDGGPVEVDTHLRVGTPPLWPVDQAAVGWYAGQTAQSNDLYIRTIDVYDELADDVMQPLTVPDFSSGPAIGYAFGTGTATAVGAVTGFSTSVGLAIGLASATADSTVIVVRVGSAAGTGAAAATSASVSAARQYGAMPGMFLNAASTGMACVNGIFVQEI